MKVIFMLARLVIIKALYFLGRQAHLFYASYKEVSIIDANQRERLRVVAPCIYFLTCL
jgi:hypothetical protein